MAETVITIDRHPKPQLGCFLVSIPDETQKHGEYLSAHANYFSALAEALKLQREYGPATLIDKVGGADAPS